MVLHVSRVKRLIGQMLAGVAVWAIVAGMAVMAVAQTGGELPGAPPVVAGPPAPPVVEVAPQLFYLQNDAGRLVPVPGFRYRDFIDLMRLKDGLPGQPEPPAAVLESISILVTLPEPTAGGAATARTCPAELRFSVRQVRPGWVSVPIDLRGFLIGGAPVHEGPGQMFFTAASDAEPSTARVWFNAASEEEVRHAVVVPGGVPVESSATSDTVTLLVPPATASRVEIRSARLDPAVTVRPASLPPVVDPLSDDEGEDRGSVVAIVGAAGPLEVRIGDRQAGDQGVVTVPDVTVESLVRVDGKTAVTEATLRLDNLPPSATTVRIGLPARTTLRRIREPAMLVQRAGTAEAPEISVRVDRDPSGRAVVGLECERTIDASGRSPFDPLGFAVAGIPDWRQRGRVSVMVEGDWQIEWDDTGANRRIDPPASARRPGFVAAFAYDSQPASLPIRVRPRGSRVVIEPEYRYSVGAARITLDARLRVSVRGAAVSRLVVALEGWEVEDVGPIGLVDATAVTADGNRLVIPFQQGLAGDSVIDFRCSRSIDRTASDVAWKFPVPEASLLGPAAVLITSETDIELVPDTSGIRGLVRQVAPAPLRSDADRLSLAYRLDGTDGLFRAQRRFLERRIDASIRTQVDIDQQVTRVAETIRFAVAHVPLEFIELLVPARVVGSGSLEIRQSGQLLNPMIDSTASTPDDEAGTRPVPDNFDALFEGDPPAGDEANGDGPSRDSSGRTRVRAMLPVPLLGAGEVTVTYELPTPEVPPETTVAENLALIVPVEAKVGRQTLQINAVDSLAIDLRGEDWKRDAAAPVGGTTRSWATARFQDAAPLALAARRREMSGETIVEAAWLQTRLLADRREDMFAYAVSTAADRIALTLPEPLLPAAGVATTTIEVWLDGRRIDDAVRSAGGIEVLLQSGGGRSTVLLEIRISRPWTLVGMMGLAGLDRLTLVPPEFAAGVQQRRFYWEVHLPSDQHVVVPPRRWTAQQRWAWASMGLERRPLVARDALASWVRANAGQERELGRDAVDTGLVSHRALYSGVGPPAAETLWIAATWLLVLAVSGPALAVGLLMVYVPAARSAWLVIGVAALLTLLAAAWPALAPMLVQGALPGVGLALLAAAMRGLIRLPTPAAQRLPAGSSLTRGVAPPSLIVARSAIHPSESVTTPGRSAS